MEKHNRRSHLAPQLSPATQELLRGSDSPTGPSSASPTPTSGEIPIDVRGTVVSPREQVVNTINGVRSPTKNATGSLGRSGGAQFHPGLGRVVTTNSIPKVQSVNVPEQEYTSGASSAGVATFSHTLPIRPLPPPPVPRKEGGGLGEKRGQNGGGYYGGNGGYAPSQ
jgi:mitogen-activated protein kinase kinase